MAVLLLQAPLAALCVATQQNRNGEWLNGRYLLATMGNKLGMMDSGQSGDGSRPRKALEVAQVGSRLSLETILPVLDMIAGLKAEIENVSAAMGRRL